MQTEQQFVVTANAFSSMFTMRGSFNLFLFVLMPYRIIKLKDKMLCVKPPPHKFYGVVTCICLCKRRDNVSVLLPTNTMKVQTASHCEREQWHN